MKETANRLWVCPNGCIKALVYEACGCTVVRCDVCFAPLVAVPNKAIEVVFTAKSAIPKNLL